MTKAIQDRREMIRWATLFAGVVFLFLAMLFAVAIGAVHIPITDIFKSFAGKGDIETFRIIYTLRLPRVLCATLAGANLALSGCILQGILRNPLADPGIIGISAGAGLAAMFLMLVAPTLTAFVPMAAFGGAIAAAVIVFALSWNRGINPLRLVLAGVAVAAFFCGGMTALSVFFSDRIQGTVAWLAGGFAGSSWEYVRMIFPYSLIGIVGALCSFRQLNALQLGDEVAKTLGVHAERTRTILVALAALLAASAVSVAGLLGFVGLIIPHVMRLLIGSDFETLLPASALFGAVLVLVADIVARTLLSPMEIPVGIFMSFVGAPFFLYLLKRRMNKYE